MNGLRLTRTDGGRRTRHGAIPPPSRATGVARGPLIAMAASLPVGSLLPVSVWLTVGGASLAIGIAIAGTHRLSLARASGREDTPSSSPGSRPRFRYSWRHGAWFPSGPGVGLIPLVGYARPSVQHSYTARQDMRMQLDAIAAECERRGLTVLETVREREPPTGGDSRRPGLGRALQKILDGEAQGLAVAELTRLGDSVPELGRVLEWFLESDVRLIAASPRLDTEEEAGRLAVRTIIELSRWEHELIVERTRKGMRAAKGKGPPRVADQPELQERIARMRKGGMTLQGIADRLNAEGVPTVRGGAKWRTSSVQTAAGYHRRPARSGRADDGANPVT